MSPAKSRRPPTLRRVLSVLVAALAVVLALLMVAAFVGMIFTAREYRRGSQFGVARLQAADQILVDMLDAETGSRGYTITGAVEYLAPYTQALRAFPADMQRLHRLVAADPVLESRVDAVGRAATAWIDESRRIVILTAQGRAHEAGERVASGVAKALQDAFRLDHVSLLDALATERRASLARADDRRRITLGLVAGAAFLALLVVAWAARRTWRRIGGPVADMAEGVRRVTRGDLSQPVPPRPAAVRELGALVAGFNKMQVDLVGQRDAVANAIRRETAQSAERELWRTLQSGLLPSRLPRPFGLRIAARYRASDAELLIGGDFFDAVILDDGRLCLVVGDVTGHGAASAAKAAGLRFAWRTMVGVNPDPEAVLRVLNEQIGTPDDRAVGRFASLLHVTMSPDGIVDLAPAGHPPPLLLDAEGCRPLRIADPGPPVGVFDDAEWPILRFRLPVGGTLVLYTDGLVEARRDGEEFGTERACAVLAADRHSALALRIERLIEAARRFDHQNLTDDVVVLALERPFPVAEAMARPPGAAR